jgi:class 3 adenylate cyclase
MALADDLSKYVKETFRAQWATRNGQTVPEPEDLKLANEAVVFDRATVLYADLSGSTAMVESKKWHFAAEIYKNFLYCAARLITDNGGQITAYDGDRIMGIFVDDTQSSNADKCVFKINWADKNIIMPGLNAQYSSSDFQLRHVVGIDTSEIRAAKTGVRGENDIVWVGRAANFAAKLTELGSDYPTWITGKLFGFLNDEAKYGGKDPALMWTKHTWTAMGGIEIYGSNWSWKV